MPGCFFARIRNEITLAPKRFPVSRRGMKDDKADLAVIGGGSAGYAAARTAVDQGMRTVVIEGGRELGGLCILRGCMPTKALLYAAEVRHLAKHSATWGMDIPGAPFDLQAVMARKNAMIGEFASYRSEQLRDGRFEFIHSKARFIDPHTVQLEDGRQLRADHFVIATGSSVSPPPIPDLESTGYLTSDSALTLKSLPKSIIVLGGGAIAVEFAQFFARFDTQTTLIQRSPRLLKEFDDDAADTLATAFADEGIIVHTGTRLEGAAKTESKKSVTFIKEGEEITLVAEEILFALGRSPNTARLDLQLAGVETAPNGRITTNEFQQTTADHIYAAGDCCSPHEVVHIAIQQGELAVNNIAAGPEQTPIDYRLLSSIVFTDPQIATVGLSEKAAKKNGIPYRAASYPFNDHGKSMIMNAKHGFVKLLASPATGEILGGACVGPVGGELIHEIIVAMAARMTVHQFAAIPHYHPTLAEIWTYPAEDLADAIPAGTA